MSRNATLALFITLVWMSVTAAPTHAQPGSVLSHQKINDPEGGFFCILEDGDWFASVASPADLDGGGGDLVDSRS